MVKGWSTQFHTTDYAGLTKSRTIQPAVHVNRIQWSCFRLINVQLHITVKMVNGRGKKGLPLTSGGERKKL